MPAGGYAESFGVQWRAYRRTQLDSYTGQPISRNRLDRCVGGLEKLRGKTVLEVGSGAGRFTEILMEYAGALVSMDLSSAVYANLENCRAKGRYLLLQADINASPLPARSFDLVLCLGVIQHTPSPEETIASLARHLKPGGWLVLDHYTYRSRLHAITDQLTLATPLRAILRRVARRSPGVALWATRTLTALSAPVRRRTCHYRWLDRIAARIFVSACYDDGTYPGLPRAIVAQWNELDTHDMLTDWYSHRRSLAQIHASLEHLGFTDIECWHGGNGVEAQARFPDSPA